MKPNKIGVWTDYTVCLSTCGSITWNFSLYVYRKLHRFFLTKWLITKSNSNVISSRDSRQPHLIASDISKLKLSFVVSFFSNILWTQQIQFSDYKNIIYYYSLEYLFFLFPLAFPTLFAAFLPFFAFFLVFSKCTETTTNHCTTPPGLKIKLD